MESKKEQKKIEFVVILKNPKSGRIKLKFAVTKTCIKYKLLTYSK